MKNKKLDEVVELLAAENAKKAQMLFNEITPEEEVRYLIVKGKLQQKFQNWSEAINAYSKVLELDPENSEAKNNLQIIQNILSFWNPDMHNP